MKTKFIVNLSILLFITVLNGCGRGDNTPIDTDGDGIGTRSTYSQMILQRLLILTRMVLAIMVTIVWILLIQINLI